MELGERWHKHHQHFHRPSKESQWISHKNYIESDCHLLTALSYKPISCSRESKTLNIGKVDVRFQCSGGAIALAYTAYPEWFSLLTLSLPRVINFMSFLVQPHQKYYLHSMKNMAFIAYSDER